MTKLKRHLHRYAGRAPRPYVAFAATSEKEAKHLYRAQNLIWIWISVASLISAATYFFRPHLGPALVTHSEFIDTVRQTLFAVGGSSIGIGIWTIRRAIEFSGHVFFATGAIMNVVAASLVHSTIGAHIFGTIALVGIAGASGFRALFILEWIGADTYVAHDEHDSNTG